MNFSDYFAKYDPSTQSWRTSRRSLFGGLMKFSGDWPRSGTMLSGRLFRRPLLVPPTGESGSSSWPTEAWQTPLSAGMSKNCQYQYDQGDPTKPRATLVGQVKGWQTPSAGIANAGARSRSGRRKGELLLGGQVVASQCPPESSETPSPGSWPTPQASDSDGGKGVRKGSSNTGMMPDGSKATVSLRHRILTEQWPTPASRDYRDDGEFPSAQRRSPCLPARAVLEGSMFPTPRASPNENRQTKPSPSQLRGQRGLNLAMVAAVGVDGRRDQGRRSTNGNGPGSLNSSWVASLQGFPPDWCELSESDLVSLIPRPKRGAKETRSNSKDSRTKMH